MPSLVEAAKLCLVFLAIQSLLGCAILHHYQLGEIDSIAVKKGKPFTLYFSETGVNFQEAGTIAKSLSRGANAGKNIGGAFALLGLFQMGPRTGNPVFNYTFADKVSSRLAEVCENGTVTALASIREMAKYPVVSGEIVKVTGYCYQDGNSTPKQTSALQGGKK